jgi:nucleolar MIF4G domain-containing protein 1
MEEEPISIEEKSQDTSVAAVAIKYVPPHLRKAQGAMDENRLRLQRQIKGLINRLSDSNMESILSELDVVYQSHSRHDVTDVLTDFLLETVGDTAKLIDSFVQTHAALIACLYNSVGVEFGSHLIEKCVGQIADDTLETKKRGNLITLIGYLYLFDVLTCVMVYDYVRDAISRLEEIDVEVLLRLLRICGQKLRSDDPSALKDIILLLKAELAKRDPESISTRLKFMVESVMDLKNNKHKKKKADADGSQGDRLKKFVVNLVRKRGLNGTEALRVGVKDIQDIKVKGKWWLVGSAWAGRDSTADTDSTLSTSKHVEISNDLLLLAKSQKMNTDVRRSIFVVLMTSEDYADAYERLLKLGLKDKQEREIARVIVQCCSKVCLIL